MRNVLHILGHGQRLRGAGKTLEICAVRNKGHVFVCRAQTLGQRLGRCKDGAALCGQFQLLRIDQRGIHQPAIGRVAVNAVIDQRAVRNVIDRIGRDR